MNEKDIKRVYRAIPQVNELLLTEEAERMMAEFGRTQVVEQIRRGLEDYRNWISMVVSTEAVTEAVTEATAGMPSIYDVLGLPIRRTEVSNLILQKVSQALRNNRQEGLKRVINATGIVLHTNLGRAPLPETSINAMKETAAGYSNLEYDLKTGERGSRHSHIEPVLREITGAPSAIVVNNNAAAVFLCLNTLAKGGEVVISRGQLVEIGGSFRIPDILANSGAKMVEVGTTNKTRLQDYREALTENTAMLLKVHTSNYRITGFTQEVSLKELSGLATEKDLIVMEDLGSGSISDLRKIGLPHEPTVGESISMGADIVTFSGDKLLGGPQAGIIAGKKELLDKIRKNPLLRMVRCDKTTIAALASILELYRDTEQALSQIPVLRMLARGEEELKKSADELAIAISDALGTVIDIEVVEDLDEVGGGSLPGVVLKGYSVALSLHGMKPNVLQDKLRAAKIPIICRIFKDRVLLNVRTLDRQDFPCIIGALLEVRDSACKGSIVK